jgi:beta-lactamase regulating signal transducer with metallopeptidase domain
LGFILWGSIKVTQTIQFKFLLKKHSTHTANKVYLSAALLQKFNKKVPIMICTAIDGPMITGLINPTIYLPQNFTENYNVVEQQLILKHELTHVKRLDLWTQLLAEVFKTIFWFNPLVHMAWIKFQQDQELACDHQVLRHADYRTRIIYGEALKKGLSALLTPISLTFFNHKHERFIMLSKHKNNIFTTLTGITFIALIGFMMLTKTNMTFAEKTDEKNGINISLDFKQIPLIQVVKLISETTPQEELLVQLDLLDGIDITTKVEEVPAFDFLDALLTEHGFKVYRQADSWQFSKI